MSTLYNWERRTGGLRERWELIRYTNGGTAFWGAVGYIYKKKNKHRCRDWNVMCTVGQSSPWEPEFVTTLKDMKRPEALDAARLLLMMQVQS